MNKAARTPETFRQECLAGLHRAQALRPEIVETCARTIDAALDRYNQLLMSASASNALAGLPLNVKLLVKQARGLPEASNRNVYVQYSVDNEVRARCPARARGARPKAAAVAEARRRLRRDREPTGAS